ncbi:MAG TPA: SGNH/GDSL hydrolase family protein [Pirellulales bacterium]|nr:SGNH/GDSL hydrolase family protein [Pirellulales bacterium]
MPSTENGKRTRRAWRRKLAALALGCAAAFVALEFLVRLYPPFELRIRGSHLRLAVHCRRLVRNDSIAKLDREIEFATNSLGFRGPDPPDDFALRPTIVAVGGSTTECRYLDETKTWPARLNEKLKLDFPDVWLNNAGLDGHSTRGHQVLLEQLVGPLKPKLVLYMVGLNDMGLASATADDQQLLRQGREGDSWADRVYLELVNRSAVFALADNLRRHLAARRAGLTHGSVDHAQLRLDAASGGKMGDEERKVLVGRHRRQFLPGYETRLRKLLLATLAVGSEPVLITQSALYGDAIDEETGLDLGRVKVGDVDGLAQWQVLESYNDVTRRIGRELGVLVIDIARRLPKNSRYYYDYHHFTNAGAEAVAEVVAEELRGKLEEIERRSIARDGKGG